MKQWQGQALAPGIAAGEVFFYRRPDRTGLPAAQEPGEEWARFEQAAATVREQRLALAQKAREEADPAAAEIFEIHAMLVEDEDFQEQVHEAVLAPGPRRPPRGRARNSPNSSQRWMTNTSASARWTLRTLPTHCVPSSIMKRTGWPPLTGLLSWLRRN